MNTGTVIFNAYPDSIGTRLSDTVNLLKRPELKSAFSLFYVLPTFFNSDLDRGFSIIDYNLNKELVSRKDLKDLRALKIDLKLDLVLNHLSVNSPQFRDLLNRGDQSEYIDFFIDWNKFWQGRGTIDREGCIIPHSRHLDALFMRKPELPVMKVRFPDGSDRFFWNTFYRDISYEDEKPRYLGQIDLNARSEKVWAFYDQTLAQLQNHGAKIVRLDAFAYLHKEPGRQNFFNRPETWTYLDRLNKMARRYGLIILPEIHAEYGSGLHQAIASKGYPVYDFFFPGLVIDALERGTSENLLAWIREIEEKGIETINMLGCHDGIPVLDLRGKEVEGDYKPGLLSSQQIEDLINLIMARGGRTKNLYGPGGEKISYYQVNATFFSALGEDERKLRMARAIQLFMPGIPQVWYLDLFAGKNDYQAADQAGSAGHKEINRTNLSLNEVENGLKKSIVQDQLAMIRLRNTSPAFYGRLEVDTGSAPHMLQLVRRHDGCRATLSANLRDFTLRIEHKNRSGQDEVLTYS